MMLVCQLTQLNNSIGFRPYTSEQAPSNGEVKNWRNEYNEPSNPIINKDY